MSATADFVRAVLEDNTRLRAEVAELKAAQSAGHSEVEKDCLRLKFLCAALMQKLGITRVEMGSSEWPLYGVGNVEVHYDANNDTRIYAYDFEMQPGSRRLEIVPIERESAAA